ncbi:TVP38/TMEM64 family protein [Listeria monocytogenes]|nr:TVP38/TMEM64 family protein [Listeria monocytogenes]
MTFWQDMMNFFSYDNLMYWLSEYRNLGPLLAFLLPFIEAFLPFLPFIVFVVVNVNAYGLLIGFLISVIAAIAGSLCVFLLARKFGQTRFLRFISGHKQIKRVMEWIDRHGFSPIFILLVMPFTPSSAENIVAGLSKIKVYQFILALVGGKLIKVFAISYIGYDFVDLIHQPLKLAILAVSVVILWFVGKRLEHWMSGKNLK